MKTQTLKLHVLFTFVVTLFMASCNDDAEKPAVSNESKKTEVEKVLAFREEFNVIENFVQSNVIDLSSGEEGRKASRSIAARLREVAPCTEAVEEEQPDGSIKVTMDFGSGCEIEDGIVLTGKVILLTSFSDSGLLYAIEFIDYQEIKAGQTEGNLINGTVDGNFIFNLETFMFSQEIEQDLTITYPDDMVGEFTSSHKSQSTEAGLRVTEFTTAGKFSNGMSFGSHVSKPLVYNFECNEGKYPVEGVETFTLSGNTILADYGNGSCDKTYTAK